MLNIRKIAQRATTISDIMEGREKVDKVDGIYHITDFDLVANSDGEVYAVCAINEKQFINGGMVLTKALSSIVEEFGNIEDAREQFRMEGGLNVRLERKKTQKGRDLTAVTIL